VSAELLGLIVWGTVVGLDLVTGPQIMVARPFVAGTVAGALLGDVAAGATVGAVLELYALDVLPVGAARYPDYGPAAVAAAATAANAPLSMALGPAIGLGLLVGWIGELAMHQLRRANARRVHRATARLEAGDAAALGRVHWFGLWGDVVRSVAVTGLGLGGAFALREVAPLPARFAMLASVVVMAVGIATAAGGALRLTGSRGAMRWLVAGMVAGVALAVWA